jgi:ubiquinone/menaquinone biosynthesis C-methylase UbiE
MKVRPFLAARIGKDIRRMMLNPNAETVLGKLIAPHRNVLGWLPKRSKPNQSSRTLEAIAEFREQHQVEPEDKMAQDDVTSKEIDLDQHYKSQMEKAAPTYDSLMKRMTFGRAQPRGTTVSLAGVKPGESVLEVGCGTGTLTLAAKRRAGPAGKVFGIDVIPQMIELSQRKAAQAGEEIAFQLASIDDIPFPANQFDVVMCSFMIFHMSEKTRQKGIAEIFRVLKPQGRLLVLDRRRLAGPVKTWLMTSARAALICGICPFNEFMAFLVEIAPVNFRLLGSLSSLSYVEGPKS